MAQVVIVDDDPSIEFMLGDIFKYLGHKVYTFTNPKRALAFILERHWENPIDLLVTDVVMPEMNGSELIERIYEDLKDLSFPILIISGEIKEVDIQKWLAFPNIHFMPKPIRFAALSKFLDSCLPSASEERFSRSDM
ncbi:MAG: response regulator [Lentisphaerae bacterium]|nr:MAG: response regulator [Lentisphaerota bacterium]